MVVDSDVRASGTRNKWSPDSRMLAAAGVIHGSPRAVLYTVSVPAGHVTVLDSVDVLATHEFSWSPDARWVVYSRPTGLDSGENPIAADLWIADAASGETWPLLETPETVELNPLWISERSIQIERRHGREPEATQVVVMEVKKQGRK